jgi:threonine dehydratase
MAMVARMNAPISPPKSPDLGGIREALAKLRQVVPPTPIIETEINGVSIWCKAESAQPIGAFKLRGAWHRLTAMSADERTRGVVAFSSGNHAQGVAWAAAKLGISAIIVMPSDAPALKLARTRALGAEVVTYDRMRESREAIAAALAAERNAVLVPSFDDPWVIEGQGTMGLEAAEQLSFAPDLVVTPCGGGGLASGIALALPDARIVTVEPEGWDDMARSLMMARIVPVADDAPRTHCDALQTKEVAASTFGILARRGASGLAVSETETAAAMRFAVERLGLTLEPGGAVALAAILAGKVVPTGRTLVVLSGGNVDPELFEELTGAIHA